jgi:predicted small secreted protein
MDRLRYCLMFILISCLLSGCNTARVSSSDLQQTSGNEDRVMDQKDQEKVPVANSGGEVGKRGEESDFPEQNVETAPFAEERLTYRPTRAGGMPTIQNPKGVPYSEPGSLYARE